MSVPSGGWNGKENLAQSGHQRDVDLWVGSSAYAGTPCFKRCGSARVQGGRGCYVVFAAVQAAVLADLAYCTMMVKVVVVVREALTLSVPVRVTV